MRNVWTLAKREFAHYFVSPIAYAVAVLFYAILGLVFMIFENYGQTGMTPSMSGIFGWLTSLILIFTPVLTMRLLAEEQNKGTIELLLTAPVRDWEVVVGKWLGAWFFGLCLVGSTVIYVLIMTAYANPDMGPIYSAYVGLPLMVGAIMAIGVFTSSLTGNLIVAAALGYVIVLVIWIIGYAGDFLQALTGRGSGSIVSLVKYLDFSAHFSNTFNRGIINTVDIVYFVSLIVVALFLATRVVEARRWR